jgi:hypothetical protein
MKPLQCPASIFTTPSSSRPRRLSRMRKRTKLHPSCSVTSQSKTQTLRQRKVSSLSLSLSLSHTSFPRLPNINMLGLGPGYENTYVTLSICAGCSYSYYAHNIITINTHTHMYTPPPPQIIHSVVVEQVATVACLCRHGDSPSSTCQPGFSETLWVSIY